MTLTLSHVCRTIGKKEILRDVSFSIEQGDVLGLIGPNGAGKTSIMKLIGGLSSATSGQILLDDKPIRDYIDCGFPLGMLIEVPSFYNSLTAYTNLKIGLIEKGVKKAEHQSLIKQTLKEANLAGNEKKRLKDFSLGMRQRLGIAMALINDPSILIFDEPINGLDPDGIHYVKNLIRKLSKQNKSVIISSHILSELGKVCNKLCFVKEGTIIKTVDCSEEHSDLDEMYNQIMNGCDSDA